MAFAIYHETTNSATNSPSTSHGPLYPLTVNAGDVLILVLSSNGDNTFSGWDTGWIQLGSTNGSPGHVEVLGKVATGSETGAQSVSSTNAQAVAFSILRYSSSVSSFVAGVTYDLAVGSWVNTASPDPPLVTATWGSADNSWIAIAGGRGDNVTASAAPLNYGNLVSSVTTAGSGTGASVWTAERFSFASGSDNPGPFTLTASQRTFAFSLTLAEAGTTLTPARARVVARARTPSVSLAINATPARAGTRVDATVASVFRPAPPEFPLAPLGIRPELYIDGSWVDVSNRWHRQQATPTRGRSDEAADTEPGSLQFVLDNADGWLTPGNPNSPWWPHVDVGMLFRLSTRAGPSALVLPGAAGSWAATPDHPSFDVTDLDIRIRVEPDVWSKGVTWSGITEAVTDFQRLVSRWLAATDNRSFNLMLYGGGHPAIEWSPDGTQGPSIFRQDSTLVAALHPVWLAGTIDVDSGGGTWTATIYTDDSDVPPADVTTWTVVTSFTGAGPTAIHPGSADLLVGAIEGAAGPLSGRVLELEWRDAINGSMIANPDFTAVPVGTTSFQDSVGRTWTVFGDAEITNWRTRFVGAIDEIVPDWPHGDNQPIYSPIDLVDESYDDPGFRPSEARVGMTASGILRRLRQGSDPLQSSLRRHVTSVRHRDRLVAYWPCEDAENAVRLSAGLTTHGAMVFTGGRAGANNDQLPASAPLPTVESEAVATFTGTVPAGPSDRWTVDWVFRLPTPETNPAVTRLMTIQSQGAVTEWRLVINDIIVRFEGYNIAGTQVFSAATSSDPTMFSGWVLGRIEVVQSGVDIVWSWSLVALDTGVSFFGTAPVTGATMGPLATINSEVTGPPDGYSFGHIVASDGTLPQSWLAGADTAWVGESAAHRFWRLCTEQGIPVEIVGDPVPGLSTLRGDLDLSEAMGPQERKKLVDLLAECAALDLGVIVERRHIPGLIYRTRRTLENQPVRLSLDASSPRGDISNPLEPRRDDQRLRNDVTVASAAGSSARAVDQVSVDSRGRYTDSLTLAGVGGVPIQVAIILNQSGLADAIDAQNLYQAGWRLHLGTWANGLRYPTLVVPLHVATTQIADWLDLELGDRIQLVNLPAQHPDVFVDLVVEQVTENIHMHRWAPELVCSPAGPWIVGELQ